MGHRDLPGSYRATPIPLEIGRSGVANPARTLTGHPDRRTCHAIARYEHSCARCGVLMNYPGCSKRALCHALTPGHWNLFPFDGAVPRLKTLAGVPPNAFVSRTTGTRMLVPRNRVARLMGCCDLLDSYKFTFICVPSRFSSLGCSPRLLRVLPGTIGTALSNWAVPQ